MFLSKVTPQLLIGRSQILGGFCVDQGRAGVLFWGGRGEGMYSPIRIFF